MQVALKTSMGQSLDLLSCQFGRKPDLDKFTMDRYNTIVKYKTAYYSFQLPVALAMYMVKNYCRFFLFMLKLFDL